ncbi:MAG: 7-cyano-7-deazaguanine synthase QueC [Fusobacteriaceae bacterium]
MKALVIFSGGQDSTTCLGYALKKYDQVEAVSFIYGQKHNKEVEIAKKIAEELNVKFHTIDLSFFKDISVSALTSDGDMNGEHPLNKNLPASYVPNRNALFITISHAMAQTIGAGVLITGVCETDFSGYPDCRNDFVVSLAKSLNIGAESDIFVETPLMYLDKKQTWELAREVGVFELVRTRTLTCYNGVEDLNEWGMGCGQCPSCKLREKGYNEFIKGENSDN